MEGAVMNGAIRVIVVGVSQMHENDPKIAPPGEDPVLAPAAALAERLGARLHVVRAFERPDPVLRTYAHALGSDSAAHEQRLEIERFLWEQTRRFANRDQIRCHAVEGRADLQLCAFAEEVKADLLVVGATRRGRIWHNLLGSTAARVLQNSAVPVLVFRHPFGRPVRRVLLTTDLSDLGPALHEVALDTVEAIFGTESIEARILLVCSYDIVSASRMSQELMLRAATSKLQQFQAERHRRKIPIAGKVRIGRPSTEIVREAAEWKADLLVLGTRSQGGMSRLLLGSTAAAALRASSGNALVIPAAAAVAWQERLAWDRPQPQAEPSFPGTEEHAESGADLTVVV
jgi:universal stress protein E